MSEVKRMSVEQIQEFIKTWSVELVTPDDVYDTRMETCRSCEHLHTDFGLERCNECNCVLMIKNKIAKSKCPLGKW